MTAIPVEELLQNARWVERLARSLVADPHDAADLAQDAWVSALRHEPSADQSRADRPLRRWLAAILRNLASDRARARRRAEAALQRAAREHDGPQPGDVVERLELHERLAAAVRALPEPYRTVIALRYFEGLAPGAIAERTQAPLRTVHTRLHRGLAALRARLDSAWRGDGRSWLVALLPLVRPASLSWTLVTLMHAKSKLVVTAVVVALLGAWAFVSLRTPAEPPKPPGAAGGAATATALEVAAEGPAPASRSSVAASAPEPVAPPAAPSLQGIAIDTGNAPAAGLRIVFRPEGGGETSSTVSDAQGAFRLPVPRTPGTLDADDEQRVAVLRPQVWVDASPHEYVLVVAPRATFAGIVVDTTGQPIAGAVVSASSWALRNALPRILSRSLDLPHKANTDERGGFVLRDAPAFPGGWLVAFHPDYRPLRELPPLVPRQDLRLVLEREADGGRKLRGRVLDAQGAPVAAAWVAAGEHAVRSDAAGGFAIDVAAADAGIGRTLRAVKPGWLPAQVECTGADARDPAAWPQPLVVVLARRSLVIEGRVVDADGRPVPGAMVTRLERTEFATIEDGDGASRWTMRADVEHLLGGGANLGCGADGRFRCTGLLERDYTLRAVDPRTLAFAFAGPLRAGADAVEIRLPAERRIARIAGRVVEVGGAPVAGAAVALQRLLPVDPLGARPPEIQSGGIVTSGADGTFEFRAVAAAASSISVRRDWAQQPTTLELGSVRDLEDLRVVLPALTHLQVDLKDSNVQADTFAVLDADGAEIHFLFAADAGSYSMTRLLLVEGRSQAVPVAADAKTLVLYRADKEALRLPLALRAGERNVVTPR